MYTGFISEVGTVLRCEDARIVVEAPKSVERLRRGGSIAVAGVCVSAEAIDESSFAASVSAETLKRSTLGERAPRQSRMRAPGSDTATVTA